MVKTSESNSAQKMDRHVASGTVSVWRCSAKRVFGVGVGWVLVRAFSSIVHGILWVAGYNPTFRK